MTDEIKSLQENDTWELVECPIDHDVINTRWVFHIKKWIDGSIEKQKGRFVAKGYMQIPGIDFNETYAPVVSHIVIRLLIALATQYNLIIHQMDVKSTFLHGKIDMELYIEQPEMFEEWDHKTHIYKLKKGLYGLKQAEWIWNQTLYKHLIAYGYMSLESEPSIYIKCDTQNDHIIIITVYVDDLQIACNDIQMLNEAKDAFKMQFKMMDLGEVHHLLGLCILQDKKCTLIDQMHYVKSILKKTKMDNCKPMNTPMEPGLHLVSLLPDEEGYKIEEYWSIVGALNYAAVLTRPDISTAVRFLAWYMQKPGKTHWNTLIWILRYLHGTVNYGLVYHHNGNGIEVYCDSDWVGDHTDCKSTTGYVIT